MNILYLSYDGLTDPLGQSQVIPYLKGCSEHHDIWIVSAEKEKEFELRSELIQADLEKSHIRWHPFNYTKEPPLISTMKDIRSMKKKAREIIRENRIEVIHCRSYVAGFVAFQLQKKSRIKILFDIRGFWADERMDGGIWDWHNPVHKFIYRYLKYLEKKWFKKADHIVSLTEKGKEEICQVIQPEVDPKKISVISCCVDTEFFDPNQVSEKECMEIRFKLSIGEDEKAWCYLGSFGTWYLKSKLIRHFKTAYDMGLAHKLILLTRESLGIRSLCIDAGLPMEAVLITSAERKEVPAYLAAMDAGIFYILDAYSKKASSPTKLGEFLAMGKPVVCNPIGDLAELFNKHAIGLCHSAEVTFSREEIEQLYQLDSSSIREVALKEFSLKQGVQQYLQIYHTLDVKTR